MRRFRRNAHFGKLNRQQRRVVSKHVRGRSVVDLGADDLSMAHELIELGATGIFAYDQSDMGEGTLKIWPDYRHRTFSQLAKSWTPSDCLEVTMLSWPSNFLGGSNFFGDSGDSLIRIISQCPKVIYLGKNTDGIACGSPDLFEYLVTRNVLDHVPDKRNTLIVYGREIKRPRALLPEELGGLDFNRKSIWWDEAEAMAEEFNRLHGLIR